MDAATLPAAMAAGSAVAGACGLRVDDAVVVNNSNRIALHLRPCGVLARVAPAAWRTSAEFEVAVARHLVESGAPVAPLDPRVEPRVHEHDDFAVTLWTYYDVLQPRDIAPGEYAGALERLHAGMRRADLPGRAVADLSSSTSPMPASAQARHRQGSPRTMPAPTSRLSVIAGSSCSP